MDQISDALPAALKQGQIETYIEPFVGGGAVFFEIMEKYPIRRAYLFDINPELVILYNVVKNDVDLLIKELSRIQDEYDNTDDRKAYFYQARDEYNLLDKNVNANIYKKQFVRRATLTIFLNRTCFNGLFRVNKKNLFNVPMGSYKNPKIVNVENLQRAAKALQNATIIQSDFSKVLEFADKKTFVYYDPPYRPVKKTSSFNSYAVENFDDEEYRRLKTIFTQMDKMGALQMSSSSDPTNYAEDPFIDDLFQGYNIYRVMAKRMINSKADKRNEIRELLITNYKGGSDEE